MDKTVFVWIIDAYRDMRWWDRLAFTMDSLRRNLPPDEDVTFRVLMVRSDGRCASTDWIEREFGRETVVFPSGEDVIWAQDLYGDFKLTDFCPAVFLRLLLPQMPMLFGFNTIASVDIDAEWRGGVKELLWGFRGSGQPFGMVRDPFWKTWADRIPFGKIPPRELIAAASGRPPPRPDYPYCGSGLVLFRPEKITQRYWWDIAALTDLGREHQFGWPEQDILNLAADRLYLIDPRYDVFNCENAERRNEAYLIQYPGLGKKEMDAKVSRFKQERNIA